MTRRFVTAFIAVFCSIPILAQHSEFPVYDDFSLPDPGKSTLLRKESLKPTDAFLDQYPDGIPAADNVTFLSSSYDVTEGNSDVIDVPLDRIPVFTTIK